MPRLPPDDRRASPGPGGVGGVARQHRPRPPVRCGRAFPRSGAADVDAAVDAAQRAFPALVGSADPAAGRASPQGAEVLAEHHPSARRDRDARQRARDLTRRCSVTCRRASQMFHFFAGAADKIHGDTVQCRSAQLQLHAARAVRRRGRDHPVERPAVADGGQGRRRARGGEHRRRQGRGASGLLGPALGRAACAEPGFPPGVVNVIAGLGEEAGDALVRHPGIGRLTFTGSTDTARVISARGADSHPAAARRARWQVAQRRVRRRRPRRRGRRREHRRGVHRRRGPDVCGRVAHPRRGLGVRRDAGAADRDRGERGRWATRRSIRPRPWARSFRPSNSTASVASSRVRRPTAPKLVFGGRCRWRRLLRRRFAACVGGYWVEPTLFRVRDQDARICREEVFGPVAVMHAVLVRRGGRRARERHRTTASLPGSGPRTSSAPTAWCAT